MFGFRWSCYSGVRLFRVLVWGSCLPRSGLSGGLSAVSVEGLFRVRFDRGSGLPISEGYYYAFPGQEVG